MPSYSRRIRAPCAGRHGSSADHVFVTRHRSPDVKGWGRVPTLGIALHRNGEGISFIGRFRHEGSLNPWCHQVYQYPNLGFANDFLRAAPHSMRALSSRRCLNGAALLRVTLLTRPMFECDGPERSESVIIFFSFELGHTRRPAAFFEE